jgi:hypothetical protein
MKIRRLLCLSVVLVLPQLAVAKLPMPSNSFGKLEGILDFCANADPQAASKYQERKKLVAGDASEQEVTEARKTQEYNDGYQTISEELAKLPKEQAAKACTAYLEGK